MTSETSTISSINKSTTSSLSNPSTKWPLHIHNFKSSSSTLAFPTFEKSNKSTESLVDEALELMRDDMDFEDDAATRHQKEARRKELLLDNLDSISQAVRAYQSGNLDLDLDSDIESDYEEE